MAEYSTIYDRYHKPGDRPHVRPCSLFGGLSPKTRQPVGQRHRWTNNYCDFCGRHRDDVMSKPEPRERSLEEIVRDGR